MGTALGDFVALLRDLIRKPVPWLGVFCDLSILLRLLGSGSPRIPSFPLAYNAPRIDRANPRANSRTSIEYVSRFCAHNLAMC